MKIGIYTNLSRDIDGRATKALLNILLEKNYEVYVCEELSPLNLNIPYLDKKLLSKTVDIMVVFGGDGTILGIAKECAQYKTKIFAVNLGHMGFLAEVENVELKEFFTEIDNGNYIIDERSMLCVKVNNKSFNALNEVVFERSRQTKMLKSIVKVGGNILNNYSSDGIIVSTPTGSTAYSLSAGGPILAPDVKALVITPICAHSLNSIPVVINENTEVNVQLLQASSAHISVDGNEVIDVGINDVIIIKKSALKVQFLRLKEYNYYEKLLSKMSFWSREVE